jgi:MYXO-CTERM domain-containing protein
MKKGFLLGALAATALMGAASVANANVVRYSYDIENFEYFAGSNLLTTITDSAAAGGEVVNFGWDDIIIDVGDNTGQGASFEPWASEFRLGYTWGEFAGIEAAAVFPGVNSNGLHGPASADNQHFVGDTINSSGVIELWAVQTWNDGTGLAHGTIISGTVWIDVVTQVPAPGALAMLGVAGLVGARRRRRA